MIFFILSIVCFIFTVLDSKVDYPAACNAMETLLIHKIHLKTDFFDAVLDSLKSQNVSVMRPFSNICAYFSIN